MNRLFVLLLLLVSLPVAGAQVAVECSWASALSGQTRLILDASASTAHQIFTLEDPHRVVLDIPGARLVGNLPAARVGDPILIGIRAGVRNEQDLRIVLDLKGPVRVKSFASSPEGRFPHRLIIDLIPNARPRAVLRDGAGDRGRLIQARGGDSVSWGSRTRTAIVAIDAGHGGEDPGALGPSGTREKDVTLAIARKLERLIEKESGLRAVMIRDGDYYVGLNERIQQARKHNADLFVSIHADAYHSPDAHGSSVYTLSHGAASSEAANWLADRENSVDLIGGVDLSASDELLASVLLDMTQSATLEHSTEAANAMLGYLRQVGAVHKSEVQRAGFVVLKSPDMPSVLVETAFISNQAEERRLVDNAHQYRLAQAMLAGIKRYFKKYPPQGYLAASSGRDTGLEPPLAARELSSPSPRATAALREYVISQGDTLSGIAKRHRVSLSSLRAENGLAEGDVIRVGQVIAIPTDS